MTRRRWKMVTQLVMKLSGGALEARFIYRLGGNNDLLKVPGDCLTSDHENYLARSVIY